MTQYTPIFVGIDVSKAHLDACRHPDRSNHRFANNKVGWCALRKWLPACHLEGVVYEATGSYHKGIERYLGEYGFPIARLDARRARRFAEALGINAKTDPVDARVLAEFGAFLKPATKTLPDPALEQLKELGAARRGLVQQGTRIANKSKTAMSPLLKRQLRQSAKQVKTQITQIDTECLEITGASPVLTQRFNILISIPSVGDIDVLPNFVPS